MRTKMGCLRQTAVDLWIAVLLGILGGGAVGVRAAESPASMNRITTQDWGRTAEGQAVSLVTLSNRHGMVAKITSYGAIITELHVPDRQGQLTNVVLGFDNLDRYLQGHPAFGATIGRVANRIADVRMPTNTATEKTSLMIAPPRWLGPP